jgi:hypothetical protein
VNRYLAELVGILSSYGMSILTFANEINAIGLVTAFAGAALTLTLALKNYRQAEGIRIDNDLKKQKLNNNG